MAYREIEDYDVDYKTAESGPQVLQADGSDHLVLPGSSYVRDADMSRDGMNLVLETDEGTVVIENYFAQAEPPALAAPNGMQLTPELVNSFSNSGNQYANAGMSQSDVSPVGAIQEIKGQATVTRMDGTVESVGIGTPIFQGDVVETNEEGAVNITFVDNTTFAISEDARLAIDEYVFDPATQSGTSNFSVLKGVFVFTSGLIGRDDPDQVEIDTPSGSIGIRGTIIAGDVDSGEITVIEGAIVMRDFSGNTITLADQFETAKFIPSENTIEHLGTLSAENVSGKFSSISSVSGNLFSSIQDSASETGQDNSDAPQEINAETTGDETGESGTPEGSADGGSIGDTGAVEIEGQATDTAGKADVIDGESVEGMATDEGNADTTVADGDPALDGAPEGEPLVEYGMMADGKDPNMTMDMGEPVMISSDIVNGPIDGPMIMDSVGPEPGSVHSDPIHNTDDDTGSDPIDPPPPPEDLPPPFFHLVIERFPFVENVGTGSAVARITGANTEHTNLFLTGTSNNYYNLVQETPNSYLVYLNSGVELDAERPYHLSIHASNDALTQAIDRPVNLAIINQNEPTVLTNAEPDELFTASANNAWSHKFAIDFNDPEGQITHYELLAAGGTNTADSLANIMAKNGIDNATFNEATGIMTVDYNSSVSDTNSDFSFGVNAMGSSGILSTRSATFDAWQADVSGTSASLTTGGGTEDYSAPPGGGINNVIINSDDNNVFTDGGNDSITIGGDNNLVNAGHGDDTITVFSGTANDLVGGAGNDTFNITAIGNNFYGGEDNDTFIIKSGAFSAMQSATPYKIDGGSQHDILQLDAGVGGTLDFTAIANTKIKGIEKLIVANGSTNNVTLKYTDVIAMTDQDNSLVIDMDGSDTLTFINDSSGVSGLPTSGTDFVHAGNLGGHAVFTDGNITLLVSGDLGNVSGF